MIYWLLTTEYPPFYGGGISTYCYHTACMLSEKGHSVTVFVNDRTVNSIKIEQSTEARIIRFNPSLTNSSQFLGYETNISYEFAHIVKTFIEKEGKPDIIESQDYNGIAYFLLQYKFCLYEWCKDIPILITMHSPSFLYMEYNQLPLYKKPNFWIGEMERFCIQAADLLISPSQYLVDALRSRFVINNTNLHIVVNPFKFDKIKGPVKDSTALNNELTFYGKLSPQKGCFEILKEFTKIWEKGSDISFTMVGDQNIVFPPLGKTMGTIVKDQYSKYIKKGLLKFKTKIPSSEIGDFFNSSIIFIVPSIVDNLPYTVLELMSVGKILIVSKQGGQSEIVLNKIDGFIFDYDISDNFALILNRVICLSKEERKLISARAVKKIEVVYSYEEVYSKKIKLLENLQKSSHLPKAKFPFVTTLISDKENVSDSQMSFKLSVIIPYYNLGRYLDEAVNSIIKSTYKNLEVLIVNDGSTETLDLEILNKYRNHSNINVLDKPNSGLADSRNYGAKHASGGFIAFLDADDMVAPTYYEAAIEVLSYYQNVHFVGAWTQYFGNSKNIWPTFNPEPPLILTHNTINSSSLVYKKRSFLAGGMNDINFKIGLEDYESVISMLAKGLNGVALPELLFFYRIRKGSMIKNSTSKVRADYYSKIAIKHSRFFEQFESRVKELIKSNAKPLETDNSTLDSLPFQQTRVLGALYRKLFYFIKANPKFKKFILRLMIH